MEKKLYRIFLALAIMCVMVAGILYYVNYKNEDSFGKDVSFVEKVIDQEGEFL